MISPVAEVSPCPSFPWRVAAHDDPSCIRSTRPYLSCDFQNCSNPGRARCCRFLRLPTSRSVLDCASPLALSKHRCLRRIQHLVGVPNLCGPKRGPCLRLSGNLQEQDCPLR